MKKIIELPTDDEEQVLRALELNLRRAVQEENNRFERLKPDEEYDIATFDIIVNNVRHTFVLGGPQITGLDRFIENIADENGYYVLSDLTDEQVKELFFERYESEWDWAHATWDRGLILHWFIKEQAPEYKWMFNEPEPTHISGLPAELQERYINYLKEWYADFHDIPIEDVTYSIDDALEAFKENELEIY